MRRSTRGNNLKTLIKDELVKRFEHVVTDEVKNYEKCVSDNQKKFDELNDRLNELLKRQLELVELIELSRKDVLGQVYSQNGEFFKCFQENRNLLHEKIKFIDNFANDLKNKSDNFVENKSIEDLSNSLEQKTQKLECKIHDNKKSLLDCMYESRLDLIADIQSLDKKISDNKIQNEKEQKEINEKIEINKVDSQGVLTELRGYKKSMFIIEKKIENIYTLIKRLEEKG